MNYMVFAYRGGNRDLRKIINVLLKAGVAKEIQKMNYVQSFSAQEKNVKKSEIKLLFILTDNLEKLSNFVLKNFSDLEKISVN